VVLLAAFKSVGLVLEKQPETCDQPAMEEAPGLASPSWPSLMLFLCMAWWWIPKEVGSGVALVRWL